MTTTITGAGGVSQVQDGSIGTADFAANAITAAKLPSGSVLQIVSNTLTTVGTTTSSTMAALGLSQAITPISTSSKIYATVTGSAKTHNDVGTIYTIYRGGTDLKVGGSGMTVIYGGSTGAMTTSFAIQVLDSPNTASAVTYSVYWRTRDNGNTSQNNWLGGETTITLMEIAG